MLRAAARGLGAVVMVTVLGFAGLGVSTFAAQDVPDFLIRNDQIAEELWEKYPSMKAYDNSYYFQDIRPVTMAPEGLRWFREMEACFRQNDIEIIDHIPYHRIQFKLFKQGWNMKDHQAVEIAGAWFVHTIVLKDDLPGDRLEQVVRHEFVHHLIGLTTHPLTPANVGPCQPLLMLDRRKNKDNDRAEPTRPRGAFPGGWGAFRDERMGPQPPLGDGGMGGPGEWVGPMGFQGRVRLLQDLYPSEDR